MARALRGAVPYSFRWLAVAVLAGVVIGPVVAAFEGVLTWSEVHLYRFWLLGLPLVGALVVTRRLDKVLSSVLNNGQKTRNSY